MSTQSLKAENKEEVTQTILSIKMEDDNVILEVEGRGRDLVEMIAQVIMEHEEMEQLFSHALTLAGASKMIDGGGLDETLGEMFEDYPPTAQA